MEGDTVKTLGIDLGTTTVSACVQEDGLPLYSAAKPHGAASVPACVQDAETVLYAAQEALEEALLAHPDVGAVGLTGAMHGIVCLDGAGLPCSPVQTWEEARILESEAGRALAGKARAFDPGIRPGYGLLTCLWNEAQGLLGDAESVCTPADAFGCRLTGRRRPLLHPSMAASFGFYSLETHAFDKEAFVSLGGREEILPETGSGSPVLGFVEGPGGKIPVYAALGDCQAAFLGSGAGPGDLVVNVGTGSQIHFGTKAYRTVPGLETRPFTDGTYLLCGAALCGGEAYAVLERFFASYARMLGIEERQYGVMERILDAWEAEGNGTCGLSVDPRFLGSRSGENVTGSITGLTAANFTPGNLTAGLLTGMMEELRALAGPLEADDSFARAGLFLAGGACRRIPYLRKAAEAVFGRPAVLGPAAEEAAFGVAVYAAGAVEKPKKLC